METISHTAQKLDKTKCIQILSHLTCTLHFIKNLYTLLPYLIYLRGCLLVHSAKSPVNHTCQSDIGWHRPNSMIAESFLQRAIYEQYLAKTNLHGLAKCNDV